jgi:hypothetical protein
MSVAIIASTNVKPRSPADRRALLGRAWPQQNRSSESLG